MIETISYRNLYSSTNCCHRRENNFRYNRTVIVVLWPILPMTITVSRWGGCWCAGSMKAHVRKDHFWVFKEDHVNLFFLRGFIRDPPCDHIETILEIQHELIFKTFMGNIE